MTYQELRDRENELLATVDPAELALDNAEASEDIAALQNGANVQDPRINEVFTALPTNKHGVLYPEFWRYYLKPWQPIFFNFSDPFNDLVTIIWGPRGGGKTITGVSLNIMDGQMKGIPCISNVPFAWIAKDVNGYFYKIESLPFDQELFAKGDPSLKFKRLQLDEGNYLADRLRSTSNKNLAMTDILQQARKFRMCVAFCTINWLWLDPRVTGSLCDILIECNDLHYKAYGRRNGLKKGYRIAWDIMDQSGKTTGRQFHKIGATTFNARYMWFTFNTENFVDPREARKKLQSEQKTIIDEFGNQVTQEAWLASLRGNLHRLAQAQDVWDSNDLWNSLNIQDQSLRIKAGQYMRGTLGIEKDKDRSGYSRYDLSALLV